MPTVKSIFQSLVGLFAVAALLAGCATTAANPEAAVQARAQARLNLMVKNNITEAYGYLTPAYRAAVSVDTYRALRGGAVSWLGAEVVKVTCPVPDRCEVVVRIDAKPNPLLRTRDKLSTHLDEVWVREGGQWWLFNRIR